MSPSPSDTIADAQPDNWVDRRAPRSWRPYLKLARMDRPIGTWLLLWPCFWSIALAAQPGNLPNFWLLFLFAVGAFIMRGAGCTFNDIVDRDFDGRVERTRLRPIPKGDVTLGQAIIWMLALSFTGLLILLQLNPFAVGVGIFSLILVAIYPFAKRFTYWPQIFLGLAFNYGALLGWAAQRGTLEAPAILLYLGGIAWTIGYDTIYAHQDKEDDALIGVKSTALKFGEKTPRWLRLFYALAAAGFALAGLAAGLGWLFLAGMLVVALHFAWQINTLDIDDGANCLKRFRSNRWVGLILFLAIGLDVLL